MASFTLVPAQNIASNSASSATTVAVEKSGTLQIKADTNKDGWEQSDFPILCETCLGPNPHLKMEKEKYGYECKICARPHTLFRWKPGAAARYKSTIICQTCSRLKNCCQTCLFDLEYGLPIQLRDKYLAEDEKIEMPDSVVNRDFYINQQAKKIATGELPYGKTKNPMLQKLARKNPYYERNQARICSFFVKGTCNRGEECPFRHEMPETGPLAKQNLRDRFHGVNDPLAEKLQKRAEEIYTLAPPEDKTITTLYVGGLPADASESDVRGTFYVFGDLQAVKMVQKNHCAFVAFKTRAAAEAAVEKLYKRCTIKDAKVRIQWGQKKKEGDSNKDKKAEKKEEEAPQDPLAKQKKAQKNDYPSMNPMNIGNAPLDYDSLASRRDY